VNVDSFELALVGSHLALHELDEIILGNSTKRRQSLDNTFSTLHDFTDKVSVNKLVLVLKVVLQKLVENTVESFLRVSVHKSIFESSLGLVNEDFDERTSIRDLVPEHRVY
jgi:hypothetical protein